ncbi:MAG: hypothetical protein WCI34_05440 [Actinomycetes bacterium]
MRIAIDIDSTLHHYWDTFATVAKSRFGIELPYENQRDWAISVLKPEQVKAIVRETHSDANVTSAVPYPNAVEVVNKWSAEGHWIHITSHRSDDARESTLEWLSAIGLSYDDLHCSFDKIPRCVELEIEVLIDDSPVNILRAIEEGIIPATLEHPWNEDVCSSEAVLVSADWNGLAAVLEPALAGEPVVGR